MFCFSLQALSALGDTLAEGWIVGREALHTGAMNREIFASHDRDHSVQAAIPVLQRDCSALPQRDGLSRAASRSHLDSIGEIIAIGINRKTGVGCDRGQQSRTHAQN